MAHKKAGGSSKNGRDSNAQRLGVKCFGGEKVNAGAILVRHEETMVDVAQAEARTILAMRWTTMGFVSRMGSLCGVKTRLVITTPEARPLQ